MFESTIPHGEAELMPASDYRHYLADAEELTPRLGGNVVAGSRLSPLSPSLLADLQRCDHKRQAGDALDMLEVMAACVRHANRVTIHFECEGKAIPLTVFPRQNLLHCPLTLEVLVQMPLSTLRVMHVEPAVLLPWGDESQSLLVGAADRHFSLSTWLWILAWQGGRTDLLPEIAGPAVYRVSPSLAHSRLPMDDLLRAAVQQLRHEATNLRDLAEWPGMGRERAIRLLNALYLQAGLIVSRSHREAASESWFGALGL